ncbi:MAG: hypothetical protein ACOC22_00935 [bacterium]
MEKYIRYKRFEYKYVNTGNEKNVQEIFNDLISEGWEIINYIETPHNFTPDVNNIVIICGKKQQVL